MIGAGARARLGAGGSVGESAGLESFGSQSLSLLK